MTRVVAGETHLRLAPTHSPPPSDCYFDDSAYSVVSWYEVVDVVRGRLRSLYYLQYIVESGVSFPLESHG